MGDRIYRTEEEIVNLQADTGTASNYLSDQRTAKFGTARRSEHIAAINDLSGGSAIYWHDAWEEFLRDNSIDNSQYIEEERGVFHRTGTYP